MTKTRMCSGILYEDKLVDVGVGVLTSLVKSGVKLDVINDVYVSHVHSDHVGDFTGLVWAMAMEGRAKPLRVVSSPSAASALKGLLELQATPGKAWVKFDIDYVRPEKTGVKSIATAHQPENLAYRFETRNGDIVLVGDTAKYDKVAEFARDCDLLVHDSTFVDGQESIAKVTNHSTARDASMTANGAGANRLVLTHISPNNEGLDKTYLAEAAENFNGKIILAHDNLTIAV